MPKAKKECNAKKSEKNNIFNKGKEIEEEKNRRFVLSETILIRKISIIICLATRVR